MVEVFDWVDGLVETSILAHVFNERLAKSVNLDRSSCSFSPNSVQRINNTSVLLAILCSSISTKHVSPERFVRKVAVIGELVVGAPSYSIETILCRNFKALELMIDVPQSFGPIYLPSRQELMELDCQYPLVLLKHLSCCVSTLRNRWNV